MAPSAIGETQKPIQPAPTKDVPTKPETPITVLTAESTTASDAVKALVRDGGVIIRNFVPQSTISQLGTELRPYLVQDEGYSGTFFPKETRKVLGLAGKSPTWCMEILSHPLWREVTDIMLTTKTASWTGDDLNECTSKPQLSAAGLLSIGPGAKAQPLHRDDMNHHPCHPEITADQYQIGRDTSVGVFVAGTKCTKENGATRFQPGSHLQATLQRPNEAEVVYALMEPGDAFMMLASCYHGGSANVTDEERWVYSSFMTKGYLRQEENQYLSVPREKLLEYPEYVQRKIGYELSQPYLGWVDLADPLAFVKGEETKMSDLFS